MQTTRRKLIVGGTLLGSAALALGGAVMVLRPQTPAIGAPFSNAELLEAGPLGDQALGPENAPVTIIEYASMTCPHCARFAVDVFPKFKERYVDTGKVRFIFREFPFDALAEGAFMLARCADKDKYFPLIEAMFQQQNQWVTKDWKEPLFNVVKQAGYTKESFDACLANQKVLDGIEWVSTRGHEKFKVDATPTFFINGEMHRGELSLEDLEKIIQPYLKA